MAAEWEFISGGLRFVIRTPSMEKARRLVEEQTGKPADLVALHRKKKPRGEHVIVLEEPKRKVYGSASLRPHKRREKTFRRMALMPEALRLREEGWNNEEIAARLGVARSVIRDWFIKAKAPPRPRVSKKKMLLITIMRHLRNLGDSFTVISKKTGVSRTTVRDWLKESP
jgi:transposase